MIEGTSTVHRCFYKEKHKTVLRLPKNDLRLLPKTFVVDVTKGQEEARNKMWEIL